jgi:O-methyltransferase
MTSPLRMLALRDACVHVVDARVPGAFVECGVWRGGSMMAVALTLLELGETTRDLYLFDTFEGMSEPGPQDVDLRGDSARDLLATAMDGSNLRALGPLEDVRRAMDETGYPPERVHYVQGDVLETVPGRAPGEIAVLRLDTDWYASTKHELKHLYPHLCSGGLLIVDDYGHWKGARLAVDEYLSDQQLRLFLHRVDYTGRLAVKP